jgi:hypothetical protein
MAEIKLTSGEPSSMAERIAKRLRNSGVGGSTKPDVTVQTGNSARRTFHNIHHTAGHQSPPVMPVSEGEKR